MIRKDQADCMGCLSQCAFSSWADNEKNSTGRLADPRSFCIQKTLQDIAHGGPVEQNLMFAGHARVPVQDGPLLFERLRPDGEAARRPDPDRGVIVRTGVLAALLIAERRRRRLRPAQDKQPPYWASIASGQAMTRTGPGGITRASGFTSGATCRCG